MANYDKATAINMIRQIMKQYSISFDELISGTPAQAAPVREAVTFEAHPTPVAPAAPAQPKKWFEVDDPVVSESEAAAIVDGMFPDPVIPPDVK